MRCGVLFLKGIDDQSQARVLIDQAGQLQLIFSGGVNAEAFLRGRGVEGTALLLGPVDQRKNLHLERPSILFNEISDGDTHKAALRRAAQIRDIFPNLHCINEPTYVQESTRDRVAERLLGIDGLNVPKTLRFQPRSPDDVRAKWQEAFGPQVLLRRAGQHGGVDTVLLSKPSELSKLHALPLDGSDYYMTEFVDYRSVDGFYRKYRFAVIDGEPFVRHLIISEDWKIHAASRAYQQHEAHGREEAAALDGFERGMKLEIADRIREIGARMHLEFFGIDCAVTPQGELLLFEANATMNLLVNPPAAPNMWEACIARMVDALVRLIETKSK